MDPGTIGIVRLSNTETSVAGHNLEKVSKRASLLVSSNQGANQGAELTGAAMPTSHLSFRCHDAGLLRIRIIGVKMDGGSDTQLS